MPARPHTAITYLATFPAAVVVVVVGFTSRNFAAAAPATAPAAAARAATAPATATSRTAARAIVTTAPRDDRPHYAPWWSSVADLERSFAADPQVIHRRDHWNKSAIHVAAARGDPAIVAWLLDQGADVSARSELGTTPLVEAASGAWAARRAGRSRRWNDGNDNPSNEPRRYRETVELLLQRGADVRVTSRTGLTALEMSAATGDAELVRMLLAAGADAKRAAGEGRTALHYAAAAGSIGTVRLLLDAGADVNAVEAPERSNTRTTPLDEAVRSGRTSLVRLLIARGANVRLPADTDGDMLRAAVVYPEILRVLLDAGADLTRVVHDDMTNGAFALTWASQDPEPRSLKMLIDAGVNKPKFLTSAYFATIGEGPDTDPIDRLKRLRAVQVLLDAGAPMNGPKEDGLPLVMAANKGHVEIILLLKSRGARLKLSPSTQPAKLGWTAMLDQPWRAWLLNVVGYELDLNSAAAYGFEDRVREILRRHPDSVNGEFSSATPLMFAARGGHVRIVKLLIEAGANVNPKIERGGWIGAAPLEAAVARGNVEVMRVLIAHGADVNIADEDGRTLLQRCEDRRDTVRPQVIELLKQHGAVARAGRNDEDIADDATPAAASKRVNSPSSRNAATIPAR